MNYKREIIRFTFFCFLFFTLNHVYIWDAFSRSDYELLTIIMNNNVTYNHLYNFPGIIVTVMYILALNKTNYTKESSFIIRKGKKKFIGYLAKDALINAFLYSTWFVAAEVLICTIRFKIDLLIDTGFYWCCILYVIILCGYFAFVGISTILINVFFNFRKASNLFAIMFFLLLNSLIIIHIDISPVYYANFLVEWFTYETFNYIQYILNLVKCVCLFFVTYYLTQMLYLRKDVIFDE